MSPKLVGGYRMIPVIQDNSNWWMIEIFYRFGLNLCNLELTNHCDDNTIDDIK